MTAENKPACAPSAHGRRLQETTYEYQHCIYTLVAVGDESFVFVGSLDVIKLEWVRQGLLLFEDYGFVRIEHKSSICHLLTIFAHYFLYGRTVIRFKGCSDAQLIRRLLCSGLIHK